MEAQCLRRWEVLGGTVTFTSPDMRSLLLYFMIYYPNSLLMGLVEIIKKLLAFLVVISMMTPTPQGASYFTVFFYC